MDISAYQHMNIRMSTRGKRPLRNLTPIDKVRAIQRIHNGETKASVSRDIGVPESTLRGWCKNEQKLRFMCRQLDTDHMPVNAPPEKRLKFENPKLSSDANQDGLSYRRSHMRPLDLASNNAILEKIAFNDFLDKTNPASEIVRKQLIGNSHMVSPPSEFAQLAMMQNFSLLSFLNSNLATAPNIYAGTTTTQENLLSQNQLPASSSSDDLKRTSRNNSSNNTIKSSQSLSVKKINERQENCFPAKFLVQFGDQNDNNNNNVKTSLQFPSHLVPSVTFPKIFSGCLPPYSTQSEDVGSNNPALMDWCNFFNASLNYIALAAAAAALQQPSDTTASVSSKVHMGKIVPDRTNDKILFNQLSKGSHSYPLLNQHLFSSDNSNDSCFDSEPEDLSVRSTNSKISSPTNSRSQSPTYLISSSTPSDAE